MKTINLFLILTLCLFCINSFGQGANCATADPFCSGTTYNFPVNINSGNAEVGPDYGCLTSQLNPIWYYLLVDQSGDFVIDIHSSTGTDINFICWGPFNSLNNCDSLTVGKTVSCGNSTSGQEWCNIPNAQTGKYYMLMITNDSNQTTNIVINQDNYGQVGAGNTNCSCFCCNLDNVTSNVNPCNPQTNQYCLNGNILFHFYATPITTGTLNIVDQPSGISQTFYPPFVSPTSFNLCSILSDGLPHTLTARFSVDLSCNYDVIYTAPTSCNACFANAGGNMQVCGLETTLNAIESIGDVNTHWVLQTGISYGGF